jgi:hypothetical protein
MNSQVWIQNEIDFHKPRKKRKNANSNHNGAWTKSYKTHFHMIHHGLDLGGITSFLIVIHYVHGDGAHNEMAIFFRFSNGNYQITNYIILLADNLDSNLRSLKGKVVTFINN